MSDEKSFMPYNLIFFKDYSKNDYEEMTGMELNHKEDSEIVRDRMIIAKELNAYENNPYHTYSMRIEKKQIPFQFKLIAEYAQHLTWSMYMKTIGYRFERLVTAFRIEIHLLPKRNGEEQVPLLLGTPFIANIQKDMDDFVKNTEDKVNPVFEKEEAQYLVVVVHIRSASKALIEKMSNENKENVPLEDSISNMKVIEESLEDTKEIEEPPALEILE
jgi:hypothetical protein